MKKTYIQPHSKSLEMETEAIIAGSLTKTSDRAGDGFQELSNKKDMGKSPIWN